MALTLTLQKNIKILLPDSDSLFGFLLIVIIVVV